MNAILILYSLINVFNLISYFYDYYLVHCGTFVIFDVYTLLVEVLEVQSNLHHQLRSCDVGSSSP